MDLENILETFFIIAIIGYFILIYFKRKSIENELQQEYKNLNLQLQRKYDNDEKLLQESIAKTREEREYLGKCLLQIKKEKEDFHCIMNEKSQKYPWLAKVFADYWYEQDLIISRQMATKKRPAPKAAQEIKRIAKEKKELLLTNKQLKYQICYYESLFPILEEYKEDEPIELYEAVNGEYENTSYDSAKKYLSEDEYNNLPQSEKFQLALDRYKSRKKSNWAIGIEYERYIGFLLENAGYSVTYFGALKGKKDMGRDLIAKNESEILVVQCKRWSRKKEIHEKHIFQLYGTITLLAIENRDKYFIPVFVTSAKLSGTAKKCAEFLNVVVHENLMYADYPMIKCNISRDGTKIYHLPFDQQYDKVKIQGKPQAMYVSTVREAEELGFRRAYHWTPEEKKKQ